MRVCKHDCDVKMFCFSRANHVSTNLKKFLSSKLDKVTLFTHSFVILSEKNPYFRKHLFAKQELVTRARLRVQDFGTGKNFCFNQCHNKELMSFFSRQSYFIKAIANFFTVFAYPDINTRGVGSYANPRLHLGFA